MKILKKAQQKNFVVNWNYYTGAEMHQLAERNAVSKISDNDNEWRIFADIIKEIKVVLDEYGYYTTVAVTESNEIIYINL